jgi:hypothetical protein
MNSQHYKEALERTRGTLPPDYGGMTYINLIPSGKVPGYDLLNEYDWVSGWVELQKIKRKIQKLKERKRDVRNTAPTKRADVIGAVKAEWEELEKERKKLLLQKLNRNLSESGKAGLKSVFFEMFTGYASLPPYYPWSEIEKTLETLPEGDKTTKEISGELAKIEKDLAEARARQNELTPACYIKILNQVGRDIRDEFVTHWRELQWKVVDPVGPQGVVLGQSPAPEQQAWKELGIEKAYRPDVVQPRGTKYKGQPSK